MGRGNPGNPAGADGVRGVGKADGWRGPALRISLIYAACGFLWVYFGDVAVKALGLSARVEGLAQTGKGWVFVGVTAVLLYVIIAHMFRSRARLAAEQRQIARRERESRTRFDLLVRNTPLGVIFWDRDMRVASWNTGAERIFGWSAAEAVGRHWDFMVPEDERAGVTHTAEALMSNTGGTRSSNRNLRKDGGIIQCEWYNTSLIDEHGRVIGAGSVVEDVTDSHQARRRQDLMLRELDHRVKNNLASILSLAQQTARSAPGIDEFVEAFTGRLQAMSRLHGLLTRAHGEGAEGIELEVLVRETLDLFAQGRRGRTTATGPPVRLDPRAAQALALALNELGTNAAKHGALSDGPGRVEVVWSLCGAPQARRVQITWTEREGPRAGPPQRTGFGTEMIQGMVTHELRGTALMRYEPDGLVCTLTLPLADVPAALVATHPGAA